MTKTLLVLNIAVSSSASRHLLRSVIDLWPSYLVVSFLPSSLRGKPGY